jgi:membrane protease subunit (stomatin/prohibitin family)
MARIIDVIEYPNEMAEEIVHRFPEGGGVADYRLGSQVIVREAQRVVFFRDGNALDVFGPGRHTIATANVPLLTQKLQDWFTSGKTAFPAEVFFVSMKEFANRKWGTPQPIIVRNPGMGVALCRAWHYCQVGDPQQFVTQLVGAQGAYRTNEIEDRLRTMLLSILQDVLGETTAARSVVDLIGLTEELGASVRAKALDDFAAIGLTLNLSISAT